AGDGAAGQAGCAEDDQGKLGQLRDQAPSSSATSSRFLRSDGKSGPTSSTTASARQTAEIGRVTKVVRSPCERISDLRRLFSSIGPSTKARTSGAGSQPIWPM